MGYLLLSMYIQEYSDAKIYKATRAQYSVNNLIMQYIA